MFFIVKAIATGLPGQGMKSVLPSSTVAATSGRNRPA